ncbi:MAG: rane dipeptidase [Thermomicrobiales bacterium]|nr:rane dipeptidase [Thermomicrobiales bacterium]
MSTAESLTPVTIATGIPVFDGHNDTLLDLPLTGRSFFERSEHGHLDLPRAQEGGLGGGFFAVFIRDPEVAAVIPAPNPDSADDTTAVAARSSSRYTDPDNLPPPMTLEFAQREAMRTVARLFRLEAESAGAAKVVRSAAELRQCLENGTFAMELHFEGAEAIDPDFDALEVYHQAGLCSLGITWSRPNRFGFGVPFQFPATPDTGPGLTDLGKELVRQCNRLRIMIDLSHLNEAGFWDVAAISDAPLVATHSNVHAICAATRNLTDRQLDAIRDSDGIVGLNFNCGFLHPEGARESSLDLGVMVDHLDALIARLGDDKVALGSDFDGATMPEGIKDVALLPNLLTAMRTRGYDDATLRKIAYENWLRVMEKTWGE